MTQTKQTTNHPVASSSDSPSEPTGRQYEISGGGYHAVVTEAGAGLRALSAPGPHGARPLISGFAAHESAHAGAGQLLAPWPNRVAGGRYRFDGEERQLDISEPTLGNAIHGLVRWAPWEAVEHTAERVVLAYRLFPHPGYPHRLDLTADYRTGPTGLEVIVTAFNTGSHPAPYGYAAHPYLTPGVPSVSGDIDLWTLHVPAERRVLVDGRMIPTGTAEVAGTGFDFRTPRPLGATALDTAFGPVSRDVDGLARVRVRGPEGTAAVLWLDHGLEWVQVFTGDPLTGAAHRSAVAVEPMSCPPDAFNSGVDLVTLAPGGTVSHRWGIHAD